VIGAKTAEWGVTVNSVEIRDVAIPDNPQDAMSRQAQAERAARVTWARRKEGAKFVRRQALRLNPKLQLRAMNISMRPKERGAPSDADQHGGCHEPGRGRFCP
jgi:regulator of protease activity HflC (stomatin/prohibitin superfamily)